MLGLKLNLLTYNHNTIRIWVFLTQKQFLTWPVVKHLAHLAFWARTLFINLLYAYCSYSGTFLLLWSKFPGLVKSLLSIQCLLLIHRVFESFSKIQAGPLWDLSVLWLSSPSYFLLSKTRVKKLESQRLSPLEFNPNTPKPFQTLWFCPCYFFPWKSPMLKSHNFDVFLHLDKHDTSSLWSGPCLCKLDTLLDSAKYSQGPTG